MKRIRKTSLTILIMTVFVSLLSVNHIHADHHEGYTEVTQTNVSVLNSSGNYYLGENITTDTIAISGTVNLCLNGKTITFNGTQQTETKGSVFYVGSGSTLNLYDCVGGGKITGGRGANQSGNILGAGVYVKGGTFNMYSGTISGNGGDDTYYKYGAGVEVCNNGTFNMYGGSISNNVIGYGAGAGVNVESGGVFNMYDGAIENNKAAEKASGVSILKDGRFNMYGGTISGNKVSFSTGTGGGVYVQQADSFYLCSDSSNRVITISGNTSNGTATNDNVYVTTTARVYLSGSLNSSSRIGIRMPEQSPQTTPPGFFTYGFDGKATTDNFTSDDSRFIVTTGTDSGNTEAKLDFPSSHEHNFTYSADGPSIYANCSESDCPLPGGKISITLNQNNFEYDGMAHEVTIDNLTNFNNVTKKNVSSADIVYYNGTTKLEGAPKDVGSYTAKLTVESATASINYEITPKTVTLNWTDTSFIYDGNDHCPKASAGGLVSGDTCEVSVIGAQRAIGTHTAEAVSLSNNNYKLPEVTTVKFTISEKPAPAPTPEPDQKKSSTTYVMPRTGVE